MKTLLLLLSLLLTCSARGATYRLNGMPLSGVPPQTQLTDSWYWKVFLFDSAGNKIGDGPFSNPGGIGCKTNALNGSLAFSTDKTSDFYGVVCAAYQGGYFPGQTQAIPSQQAQPKFIPFYWLSAYEVGGTEPQANNTGPFNAEGQPEGDPMTGESAPSPKSYEKSVTLVNSENFTVGKQVQMVSGIGQVLRTMNFFLPPNSAKTVVFSYHIPFSILVYDLKSDAQFDESGNKVGDVWTRSSTTPTQTVNSDSSQNPSPSNGQPSVNQGATTPTSSTQQAATTNQARPGTAEGNADARNKELRDEIARGTEQTRQSGDRIAGAIGDMGDKLKKAIDGQGGGSGTGTGSGIDQGDAVEAPKAEAASFFSNLTSRIDGLYTAMQNLRMSVGLGGGIGSVTPSWTISIFGRSTTISLGGVDFSFVRALGLWSISMSAVWLAVGIIRGAMADEGK